jgi:hypothetical protein
MCIKPSIFRGAEEIMLIAFTLIFVANGASLIRRRWNDRIALNNHLFVAEKARLLLETHV